MEETSKPAPKLEISPKTSFKVKPYELIKINRQDFVDRFARRIQHLKGKLLHKSMCEAYNQALTDMQYTLMAAEKNGDIE